MKAYVVTGSAAARIRLCVEADVQLHASAAVAPVKETCVLILQEAMWARVSVIANRYPAFSGNRSPVFESVGSNFKLYGYWNS
jgi:hypothetical protein